MINLIVYNLVIFLSACQKCIEAIAIFEVNKLTKLTQCDNKKCYFWFKYFFIFPECFFCIVYRIILSHLIRNHYFTQIFIFCQKFFNLIKSFQILTKSKQNILMYFTGFTFPLVLQILNIDSLDLRNLSRERGGGRGFLLCS